MSAMGPLGKSSDSVPTRTVDVSDSVLGHTPRLITSRVHDSHLESRIECTTRTPRVHNSHTRVPTRSLGHFDATSVELLGAEWNTASCRVGVISEFGSSRIRALAESDAGWTESPREFGRVGRIELGHAGAHSRWRVGAKRPKSNSRVERATSTTCARD